MLLPGRDAARVRRQAAELLVRVLGGDLGIVDEVCRARGLQHELAARAPEHPGRLFGEAVEAGGVTDAGPVEQLIGRMLPSLFEKFTETLTEALTERLTLRIDERFADRVAAFEKQHRTRGGPYALPNADPRPLTIAGFLKERAEPVPRNFAPAFGTLVAVSGIPIDPPHALGAPGGGVVSSPRCSDSRRPSSRASPPRAAGATLRETGPSWNTAGIFHSRIARA